MSKHSSKPGPSTWGFFEGNLTKFRWAIPLKLRFKQVPEPAIAFLGVGFSTPPSASDESEKGSLWRADAALIRDLATIEPLLCNLGLLLVKATRWGLAGKRVLRPERFVADAPGKPGMMQAGAWGTVFRILGSNAELPRIAQLCCAKWLKGE